jgi:hypothetical protein
MTKLFVFLSFFVLSASAFSETRYDCSGGIFNASAADSCRCQDETQINCGVSSISGPPSDLFFQCYSKSASAPWASGGSFGRSCSVSVVCPAGTVQGTFNGASICVPVEITPPPAPPPVTPPVTPPPSSGSGGDGSGSGGSGSGSGGDGSGSGGSGSGSGGSGSGSGGSGSGSGGSGAGGITGTGINGSNSYGHGTDAGAPIGSDGIGFGGSGGGGGGTHTETGCSSGGNGTACATVETPNTSGSGSGSGGAGAGGSGGGGANGGTTTIGGGTGINGGTATGGAGSGGTGTGGGSGGSGGTSGASTGGTASGGAGAGGTGTGGGSGGTAGGTSNTDPAKPEPADDFCKKHPELNVCKNSTVSLSCGQTNCEGDAITCAILRTQQLRDCEEHDASNAQFQLGSALLSGRDPMSLPTVGNAQEVDVSQVVRADGWGGGGQCFKDKTINLLGHSIVLPISRICEYLIYLRYAIMLMASLVSFRMLSGSILRG